MRKLTTTVDVRVKANLAKGISLDDFLMELESEIDDTTGKADVYDFGFRGQAVDPVTNDDGTVSTTLLLDVTLLVDEGVELYHIMNELDYAFESGSGMGAVVETEMLEYAVVDSR